MNLVFKYFRLQQIDSQLDRVQSRLEEINARLADRADLDQAAQDVERAQSQLEARQKELRNSEQETAAHRGKIKDSERQLYGGKISNPKELQDLQREVEALLRHLKVLEDRQLDAMILMEEANEVAADAQTAWRNVEARSIERNATLLGERGSLQAEVLRLTEERKAASGPLEPAELETYEKLRRSKNGVAVARVTEKTCSACGSTLSPALIQSAQSPNDITRCPTCGRMLYGG